MARQSYDLQLTRYGEEGLAGDVLPGWPAALCNFGGRLGLGAEAMDCCAAGGVESLRRRGSRGDVVNLRIEQRNGGTL